MSADYTTTNERRRLLKYKWEPNVIISEITAGAASTGGTNSNPIIVLNSGDIIKYTVNGVRKARRGGVWLNYSKEQFDTGTTIEIKTQKNSAINVYSMSNCIRYFRHIKAENVTFGNSRTGDNPRRFYFYTPLTIELKNCTFIKGSNYTGSNQLWHYGSVPRVILENVRFKNDVSSAYANSGYFGNANYLLVDNVIFEDITSVTFAIEYYTTLKTFIMKNCNYTSVKLEYNGGNSPTSTTLNEITIENCPDLKYFSFRQKMSQPTKQIFLNFVNCLPQRESDNRGTLKFYNNYYRTDTDVSTILADKNWDYVAI